MPSLTPSLIALAFMSIPSSALPYAGNGNIPYINLDLTATPSLPLREVSNTGASPLPSPTGTLKSIQLGLGFQNYTCSSSAWIQTVPSAGAIANLYDITRLVTQYTSDSYTQTTLHAFEDCLKATFCQPSPGNNYCASCHQIATAALSASLSGLHFFEQINNAQTPNFHIWAPPPTTDSDEYLSAKKVGTAKAAQNAYAGANALGAVAWLYLVDNGDGRTKNLKSVYRIETAGGVAPASCEVPGETLQVPYAAEYWFYDGGK
ncbi:Hypothetical predicted protein [Lecanosticta acicola]|uniref:Malate dehydrogenase n=1 Tax=Lecanosticta acicola TaxID=111012 RepID=A0AAI9E9L2_9PEZI|nr:Hypothetical predicted protein [Lecanosticta acicola]